VVQHHALHAGLGVLAQPAPPPGRACRGCSRPRVRAGSPRRGPRPDPGRARPPRGRATRPRYGRRSTTS
jgi:hypothetical protein